MGQPQRVERNERSDRKALPITKLKDQRTVRIYLAAMRWMERMGQDYVTYPKLRDNFKEAWEKVKLEVGVSDGDIGEVVAVIKRTGVPLATEFEVSIRYIVGGK